MWNPGRALECSSIERLIQKAPGMLPEPYKLSTAVAPRGASIVSATGRRKLLPVSRSPRRRAMA